MDGLELGTWLDPELLHEDLARMTVGLQSVGLTAAAIQREHQLRVHPFAPRVLARESLELADQFPVTPGGEVSLDPHLDGRKVLLLHSRDLGRRERRGGQLGQRRAAPKLKRLAQCRRSVVRAARRQRFAALADQALEVLDVSSPRRTRR